MNGTWISRRGPGLALACVAAVLSVGPGPRARAEDAPAPAPKGGRKPRLPVDGPEAALSRILGRPTDRGITLSVRSTTDLEACVDVGPAGGTATTTPVKALPAHVAVEFELTGLTPSAAHTYRLRTRRPGTTAFAPAGEGTFHTQRAPGATFTFALQGDSHPERQGRMFEPDLYVRTLGNVAADRPDFYLLLGDDFSIDPLLERGAPTAADVDRIYAHQRGYLGLVGASAPLFLVNGNHEQAARYRLDGRPDNPSVLAGRARVAHFPLPAPDAFYTGNAEPVEHVGLPRDYYAWTWGDALFVTLDPYWHSKIAVDGEGGAKRGRGEAAGKGKGRDLWDVTLGEAQYRWLEKTLATSQARWKFVFAHHVHGTGRGAVEQARWYEWGGQDPRGGDVFAQKRPGWSAPVHGLFVRHGVTIFFQGHDHLFARQELDGVVYQEVPNPADATYAAFNREAYLSGEIRPNSGHVRVVVAPASVRVDYVRGVRPGEEARAGGKNGDVAFSYTVTAPRKGAR